MVVSILLILTPVWAFLIFIAGLLILNYRLEMNAEREMRKWREKILENM